MPVWDRNPEGTLSSWLWCLSVLFNKEGDTNKAEKLLLCHQVNCVVTVSPTLVSSSPGALPQFRYWKAVTLREKSTTLVVTNDLLLIVHTTLGEGQPTLLDQKTCKKSTSESLVTWVIFMVFYIYNFYALKV